MKKLAALLMVVATFGLSACSFGGATSSQSSAPAQTEENSPFVSLANFEQWGPDFQMLRLINNFGKVTRNKDASFVKEGKYSAKLQPVGGYLSGTSPLLYMPTTSTYFEYDYQDFSKYDEVSAYFYNDSDKSIDVTVGLVTGITSASVVSTASGDTVTLPAKKWQRVDYWLSHNLLGLSTDLTKVKGIYFQFPNQGVLSANDAPTIYMDDVRLLKNDGNKVLKDLVELDVRTVDVPQSDGTTKTEIVNWELLDFEKDYQKYIYRSELKGIPQENFECSVVKAEDYGITAPSGENVLHVTHHSGTNFGKIFFSQRLLEKLGIADVPAEEYKTTYLKFDVYGADYTSANDYITFQFSTAGSKGLKESPKVRTSDSASGAYVKGEWYKYGGGHWYTPNKWTTYTLSLYELFEAGEAYVKTPGEFAIWINANPDGVDRDLFLDNFRMEKGEKLFVLEDEEQT